MPSKLDPGEALHRAVYSRLEGVIGVHSEGAVYTDEEPPYAIINVPSVTVAETKTTLTHLVTLDVRIHTHHADGRASDAVMYRERQRVREALRGEPLQVEGYHLLRLRPPQQTVTRYETDAGFAIDSTLSFQRTRLQELPHPTRNG